jgi:hypothetical protein
VSKIPPEKLQAIDAEAQTRAHGDAALWQHHRALLEGEYRLLSRSWQHFQSWQQTQSLPQYKDAEASVIEGWRKWIENTVGIPRHAVAKRIDRDPPPGIRESILYLPCEQQADVNAINRAIILRCCLCPTERELVRLLKERADSIRTFAANGDVDFFRGLGRALSQRRPTTLRPFYYAFELLSRWLIAYLWLMPERTAADCLSTTLGSPPCTIETSDQSLRRFKAAKATYKLKAHSPSLIDRLEPDGRILLTRQGKLLLERK